MIGRTGDGSLKAMYEVMHNGVRFCSICGERMKAGSHYSKRVIYDPIYRRETWMAQCTLCVPVTEVPWNDLERRDTPVRVSTPPPMQNTTGDMKPLRVQDSGSWLNSSPRKGSGWSRQAPSSIADVRTMTLGAVRVQTDPKLWALLKGMVGK